MTLPVLALSQTHLTLLETCPRRFQYLFDQALAVPINPEGQAAARWGDQFHLIMQQQALGLSINRLSTADAEMAAKVNALKEKAPHLFQPSSDETLRQSEHQRVLAVNGYLFTVIYDLLLLRLTKGLIVDWKTFLKPPPKQQLMNDWQTRLYLYVLAETTDLPAEQLTMVYWFVRNRDREGNDLPPSEYRFPYSLQQHERTRADLVRLTELLSSLRCAPEFPKTDDRNCCTRCPFQMRCQRVEQPELPIDLDIIEEVSL
ncbi:MAG: PD-(D/E)XK nuclease family protein [Cyanobacteria bacterium P01_D01_bin.156]